MFILYDLIFLIVAIFYLPVYLFRRKFHRGFAARLGFLPKGLALDRPVWLHAVSVGEAMAIRPLFRELKKIFPEKKFVLSTVTPTGNKIVRAIAGEGDLATFLPLDFSFIVGKVIRRINPCVFIIVETEIWPNLIRALYRKNIPLISLNARISDQSFHGYRLGKFLLKPLLNKITLFCAQTGRDAERLALLGVATEKVKATGNMKFDTFDGAQTPPFRAEKQAPLSINPERSGRHHLEQTPASMPESRRIDLSDYADNKNDYTDYRIKLGLSPEDKLLVAGSTHPGEEEILLEAYKNLRRKFPGLKLLLAPRHPERGAEVAGMASRFFHAVCVSQLLDKCPSCAVNNVFVLDSIGQLAYFYRAADIVFVGGSLVKKGGHNILEPAAEGKPVIFGPFMFNFRDIAELFLNNGAALLARNPEELTEKISGLLSSPAQAAELVAAGRRLIQDNQGATRKNLEYIKACLGRQAVIK